MRTTGRQGERAESSCSAPGPGRPSDRLAASTPGGPTDRPGTRTLFRNARSPGTQAALSKGPLARWKGPTDRLLVKAFAALVPGRSSRRVGLRGVLVPTDPSSPRVPELPDQPELQCHRAERAAQLP